MVSARILASMSPAMLHLTLWNSLVRSISSPKQKAGNMTFKLMTQFRELKYRWRHPHCPNAACIRNLTSKRERRHNGMVCPVLYCDSNFSKNGITLKQRMRPFSYKGKLKKSYFPKSTKRRYGWIRSLKMSTAWYIQWFDETSKESETVIFLSFLESNVINSISTWIRNVRRWSRCWKYLHGIAYEPGKRLPTLSCKSCSCLASVKTI